MTEQRACSTPQRRLYVGAQHANPTPVARRGFSCVLGNGTRKVIATRNASTADPQLTPDEASQLSGIVSKRAERFGTIELASKIDALKAQLAATQRAPTPIRRPFAIA